MSEHSYTITGKTIYVKHNINKILDLGHPILKNISFVMFDEDMDTGNFSRFDQPIILTSYITDLILGHSFN